MAESRSEEFWKRLVAEAATGKSASEVARRHGVSACSVLRWRAKLLSEKQSTALVPVRITGTPARRVEIEVGAVRVSFEEGTEPRYVAAVAQALRG